MAGRLQLGDFVFDIDDLPDSVDLGGEQMLAVIKYPGGRKEVQAFGPQDDNPKWSGTFNYNAHEKVAQLDAMYRKGDVLPLYIGALNPRYGVIKSFKWKYRNEYMIDYDIEIELAPQYPILFPQPQGGANQSTAATAPPSDAPAPKQTYVVKSGESLWSIAWKFYKDGSQYRKIADENKIPNPDLIYPGQTLVIPP